MKIKAIITIIGLAAMTSCHKKPHDIKLPEPEVTKAKAPLQTSASPTPPVAEPTPVIAVPPSPVAVALPVPAPP